MSGWIAKQKWNIKFLNSCKCVNVHYKNQNITVEIYFMQNLLNCC